MGLFMPWLVLVVVVNHHCFSVCLNQQNFIERNLTIFIYSPRSSYLSVEKHPFENHNNVYHELTIRKLETIYNELNDLKENSINDNIPIENSIIIIDDFANALKDNDLTVYLNKMIIKARHISCCFIITL